jgi:hypothetical protein
MRKNVRMAGLLWVIPWQDMEGITGTITAYLAIDIVIVG